MSKARMRVIIAVLAMVFAATALPAAEEAGAAPEALALRAQVEKKFGAGYQFATDAGLRILFATTGDTNALTAIRERAEALGQALRKELFPRGLERYLAIVIPATWRGTAKGFFQPEEHTILLRAPNAAVLSHEFTHAMHLADQEARGQAHQNWIIEGLAAMYESSRIEEGLAVPLPNYRLKIIQNLVRGGHHKPWAAYVKFTQREFMREPGNHYSQARYMLMYVREAGTLRAWYDSYVAGFAEDPTGGKALEQAFGKPLAEIEKDWVRWLLALPPAPADAPPGIPAGGKANS
jgi:hypothetical protein